MAEFQDPFNKGGRNFFHQEFHFGGDPRAQFFGQQQQQRQPQDYKTHIFQCYKDTAPNQWKEIERDEIKEDIGKLPKIMDAPYYYAAIENGSGDYIIFSCFAAVVLWNHEIGSYVYSKEDGNAIPENSVFVSFEEARDHIVKQHNEKRGTMGVICWEKTGQPIGVPQNAQQGSNM